MRSQLATRLARDLPAGVLATIVMDSAMLAAARLGGETLSSPRLGIDVIGRWGMGLARGQVRQSDEPPETPQAADILAGLATHYATGIGLTEAFLLVPWRPGGTLPSAIAYGLATAALPLFVLFPSLGYGMLGRRTGEAGRMARTMLLGHLAFGVGIGAGALLSERRPASGACASRCPCPGTPS